MRNAIQWLVVLVFLVSFSVKSWASDDHPLAPPDTSSPRATINSFLDIMRQSKTLLDQDPYLESRASIQRDEQLEEMTEYLFDFRETPVERVEDVANYIRPLMMEILDRIDLPGEEMIPDADMVKNENLRLWMIPNTEITLIRIEDGARQRQWVFSAETVKQLRTYYERIKNLPYRPDAIMGHIEPYGGPYQRYVLLPEESFPNRWIRKIPAWGRSIYLENAVWKWLGIGITIGLGTTLFILIRTATQALRRRLGKDRFFSNGLRLIPPVGGAVLAILVENFIDEQINGVGVIDAITETGLYTITQVCWAWAIIELGGIIARFFVRQWQKDFKGVHHFLASIAIRLLTLAMAIGLVIYGVERLGLSIMPLLAGLGIGGIAIALAVRPTLENLIGGIVLLIDKPVEVGDLCSYSGQAGEQVGVVEKIGLRSTRLRKFEDTLVSIPNAEFCQLQLENLSRREMTLLQYTLNLRYETSADQLRHVLTYLRRMLIGHPKVSPERLRVRFTGFGASSLDVEIFAYIRTRVYPEYWAIREDINLRIIDIVNDSGTGFAFPSQTTYYRRDTGLDDEKTRLSEAEVAGWRYKKDLPFPDFKFEDKAALTDTLRYPPVGSSHSIQSDRQPTPVKIWKWKRHQRSPSET